MAACQVLLSAPVKPAVKPTTVKRSPTITSHTISVPVVSSIPVVVSVPIPVIARIHNTRHHNHSRCSITHLNATLLVARNGICISSTTRKQHRHTCNQRNDYSLDHLTPLDPIHHYAQTTIAT